MLKHYYNEIKRSFAENKIAVILSIVILLISLILGYLFHSYLYNFLNPAVEELTNKVQSGVIKLTFQDIFLNNISIVFKMFLFGILFCFSVVILAYNGFFIGYYIASSNNLTRVLLLIVPHGIFEFSSCILACASGLVLFKFFYTLLFDFYTSDLSIYGSFMYSFSKNYINLKQSVILLIVSSVLMIIAAIFEVYITVPFAHFVTSFFIAVNHFFYFCHCHPFGL